MKHSYFSVCILCLILMLNIILTQFTVHQYFYGHFKNTLIFSGLNVLLFPMALYIYKKEKGEKV
jgi:cell shape-determining protein MreD